MDSHLYCGCSLVPISEHFCGLIGRKGQIIMIEMLVVARITPALAFLRRVRGDIVGNSERHFNRMGGNWGLLATVISWGNQEPNNSLSVEI